MNRKLFVFVTLLALVGMLVGWITLYLISRPLGGITGDICGAALEITQTAYLVAAALA